MKYGLIGEKLPHSFSKIIHEAVAGYTYELKELKKEELRDFMLKKDFSAINVTMPYKQDVIPYLDYLDGSVKAIGACNVIVNKNGKLYGYNTDYQGFVDMLSYFDISLENQRVAILGTGGASKTVQYACKTLNAKETYVISRKESEDTYTYADLYDELGDIDVIVNTTPSGMFPNNGDKPVNVKHFLNLKAAVDVIYNPLRTSFIVDSDANKVKTATGLYMLVAQAIYAIEYFLDTKLDKNIIKNYYKTLLKEKENIVLIGMPTSGKTTIGKELANRLNKKFYDIDEEVIKVIEMPISDYFSKYGEEQFRYVESNVIKTLSVTQGVIIATGGGSILKEENVKALKQNGKLFFLDRSLENLITTDDRPLSSNKDLLKQRYIERYDLYKRVSDVTLDGNRTVEEIVKELEEEYR